MKQRDTTIDALRFVGIALIVLAHVVPPFYVLNFRCFDVPLMLFVSGLAYANKNIEIKASFFWGRFKRLVIPVYLFLIVYFLLVAICKYGFNIDFGIRKEHIIGSFLLMDGIGYVWIIRIFLMIALLTPFIIKLNNLINKVSVFWSICFGLIILQEVLLAYGIGTQYVFIREFIYYALGYSIIFLIGLRIKNMKKTELNGSLICVSCFFVGYIIYRYFSGVTNLHDLLNVNSFKYPPRMYFILYGLFMSILCYIVVSQLSKVIKFNTVIKYIGMNTIWIYLYHIPLIQITGMLGFSWWIRYIVVFPLAVIICFIQTSLVDKVLSKHIDKKYLKYLKG